MDNQNSTNHRTKQPSLQGMITLIHPSRSRPQMAFDNYRNWMSKVSGENQIEHILSLDIDEPNYNEYLTLFDGRTKIIRFNPSDGYVVGATNEGAKYSTGNILIYLSDDFDCPQDWDKLILKALDTSKPQLLKVDDCLQGFGVAVLTIPIMTRTFYDTYGYFFYPEYKSMFCDEDLYHVAKNTGAMVFAEYLKFPHKHPSNPNQELRSNNDHTYNRSSNMWEQGKAIFNKRKAINFNL